MVRRYRCFIRFRTSAHGARALLARPLIYEKGSIKMNRSLRHRGWSRSAWLTSAWAFGLGCGLPADSAPAEHTQEAEAAPVQEHGTNAAALTRATSCDAVLSRIQSSTIE